MRPSPGGGNPPALAVPPRSPHRRLWRHYPAPPRLMGTKTPRELGYQMPAEWQSHTATWLSWPRPDGISFPDRYAEALPTLGEMVRTLAARERVDINVRNEEVEAIARQAIGDTGNVFYHHIPSYEPWCRDHGPGFVNRGRELAIVDWG